MCVPVMGKNLMVVDCFSANHPSFGLAELINSADKFVVYMEGMFNQAAKWAEWGRGRGCDPY